MIAHQSLPELVRLTLRRRILNNELAAGERLTEASLAAEFGVSRTTLRSALTALQNDRLVEFSPRRGCFAGTDKGAQRPTTSETRLPRVACRSRRVAPR